MPSIGGGTEGGGASGAIAPPHFLSWEAINVECPPHFIAQFLRK